MRKIIQPCGFHCIKINNLGVSFGEQTVLEDVNMHIHCGSFNVIIGQTVPEIYTHKGDTRRDTSHRYD